jgi:hypothetical protein
MPTLTGQLSWRKGLLLLVVDLTRPFVLCERNFGWRGVWGFNLEALGPLRLRACATCRNHLAKASPSNGAELLLSYILTSALQLTKITENLNQGSRVVWNHSFCGLGRPLRDNLDWSAEHQSYSVIRGRLVSRRSARVPSKLSNWGVSRIN